MTLTKIALALVLLVEMILFNGCSFDPVKVSYPKNNLIVRDANGNYYVLIASKIQGETYYCNPVTNVSFAVPE